MQKQALSLLISMLLHLFSHRMDLRCFLSGPGRARRCAVLSSYNFCIFSLLSYCKSTDVKCSYAISPGIIVRDFCFVNCRETILLIPYNFIFILCRNSADLPLSFTGYFLFYASSERLSHSSSSVSNTLSAAFTGSGDAISTPASFKSSIGGIVQPLLKKRR